MSVATKARPRLRGHHFLALGRLPRDGRPIGALAVGKGTSEDRWLFDLAAWGFCIFWPGRGWQITEQGVAAIDAERHDPPRRHHHGEPTG